jgi:hypothetical protein
MAIITRDFHPVYSLATQTLVDSITRGAKYDDDGKADIISTDLHLRTLTGKHSRKHYLFDYNRMTEALATVIAKMDLTHPTRGILKVQDDWQAVVDDAADIIADRNVDKDKRFTKEAYEKLSASLEDVKRKMLGVLSRRSLVGVAVDEPAAASVQTREKVSGGDPGGHGRARERRVSAAEVTPPAAPQRQQNSDRRDQQYAMCEHGCGNPMKGLRPYCNKCGGFKSGSWACSKCLRVTASIDEECSNRVHGCEGMRLTSRLVDIRPGSEDNTRAAVAKAARDALDARGKGGGGGKGGKGKGSFGAQQDTYYGQRRGSN